MKLRARRRPLFSSRLLAAVFSLTVSWDGTQAWAQQSAAPPQASPAPAALGGMDTGPQASPLSPAAEKTEPPAPAEEPVPPPSTFSIPSGTGGAPTTVGLASQAVFDPDAATREYLASVPPEKRAQSDAYFEGGYLLQLVQYLYSAAVLLLLLFFGWSIAMRDRAERTTRFKPIQTLFYWAQFLLVISVLGFPLDIYLGFFREHQYGLSNQTLTEWLWDYVKGLGVALVLNGILLVFLYGVLRRAKRTWWLWGSAVFVAFLIFVFTIAPVLLAPIFNEYKKLEDPKVLHPILSMARANGVKTDAVYQFDQSKQHTRVSANVSGFLGTDRISLNDNLLNRCNLQEIKAVMGHEIGHYALGHAYESIVFFSALIVVGFAFVRWGADRFGARCGIRDVGDLAGLPLGILLFTTYLFVLTPIGNTYIRTNEAEADIFGLNAAREPDGFATTALKLGDYRKLDPGPIEEWIFFDHPSGHSRIQMAMRWKAEHLNEVPAPSAPK